MFNRMITCCVVFLLLAALMLALTACGNEEKDVSYADGTYTGRSADHADDSDGNGSGYGEVTIEIIDGKIASCQFSMYELDGTVKDESYGSDLSQENRLKAQKAVQSAEKYASMLVQKGSLDGVDTISGATITLSEFKEAVNAALSEAEK